jgi:curved DNA-binding protein CbpA
MGEVVVAEGMLSEEHLHRATELVVAQQKRLGEALLELGIVDDELLEEFLAIHVRAILVHVFSWRAGSFYFEEQDPETSLEVDFPLKMSTGEMLMDAVRALKDPELVRFGLGERSRVLLQSTEPLLRFQRITLTPIDGFVLSRVDGTLTIEDVVQVTPLPDEAIEASLFALLCAGILELAPKPRQPAAEKKASTAQFLRQEIVELHGKVSTLAPHEVLGVAADASPTEAKAAFMKLAKRYHPDVHHDPALADLRDKLEGIFFALNDAYQALSSPKPAAPPAQAASSAAAEAAVAVDDGERAAHAEQMFGRAQENFQAGKYWEALALAGEVVYLSQGRLRRRARMLLARCYMKRSESLKKAEQELLGVIGEDADNPEAHFHLGMLFDQTGRSNRAASMFRRVLEIDPRHREATAELQRLESKGGGERSGLLGKLFGKG